MRVRGVIASRTRCQSGANVRGSSGYGRTYLTLDAGLIRIDNIRDWTSQVFGIGEVGQNLGTMVANVTINLPNSRTHEVEADRIGVELAARAGFDPKAAVTLWEKMAKQSSGGQPPKFLSTHPSHEDRINDLRAYAEKVAPLYAAAKGGSAAGR